MPEQVVYVLMGIIIFLIVFITIRFILQMVLLKDCPHCGRQVSLAQGRECKKCGYVFLKSRYTKLNWITFFLTVFVLGMGYLDYRIFTNKTDAFISENSYLQEMIADTESETESVPTESAGTEAI